MYLTRQQTKLLQGIAILCMFGLHLFNRASYEYFYDLNVFVNDTPLLLIVSYSFDACVPIYLFCSGYGLYKTYDSNQKEYVQSNKKRILNLLIRFWIILIITCITGYLLGMEDIYPGTITNFIANAFLLKSSYIGAFWFIQTYVLLVLSSKYLFQIIEKIDKKWIIILSALIYCISVVIERKILVLSMSSILRDIINAFMLYFRSQFSFMIGVILARFSFLDKKEWLIKIKDHKCLVWGLILIIIAVRGTLLRSMAFAPISGILFVILLGTYDFDEYIERLLLFFGKHSTNMWLTHM